MIAVARDYQGLHIATLERLQDLFDAEERERMLRRATEGECNREQVFEAAAPRYTLSEGYYTRVEYLFQLEDLMQRLEFRPEQLTVTEYEGVRVIAQARAEFQREHPPCPQCGALNKKFVFQCRRCHHEFPKPQGRKVA